MVVHRDVDRAAGADDDEPEVVVAESREGDDVVLGADLERHLAPDEHGGGGVVDADDVRLVLQQLVGLGADGPDEPAVDLLGREVLADDQLGVLGTEVETLAVVLARVVDLGLGVQAEVDDKHLGARARQQVPGRDERHEGDNREAECPGLPAERAAGVEFGAVTIDDGLGAHKGPPSGDPIDSQGSAKRELLPFLRMIVRYHP